MELKYNIGLEKGSKKHRCPSCNKDKEFVRYKNFDTEEYLPINYGRCERIKCGYKNHAIGEYLRSIGAFEKKQKEHLPGMLNEFNKSRDPKLYGFNKFILFLTSTFGQRLAKEAVERFRIGTTRDGKTIFWQIDSYGGKRTGKIILYNQITGNRNKKVVPKIDWVHSQLGIDNSKIRKCLYGEHQLTRSNRDRLIAIVESEKTAVIMSILLPNYLWLATGGVYNLKPDLFSKLEGRKIILFPDANGYHKWEGELGAFYDQGFSVALDETLEKKLSEEEKQLGLDLADYLVIRDPKYGWALTDEGYPVFWDV